MLCKDLPLPQQQILGMVDYVLVAPGDAFRGEAQLTTPRPGYDDVTTWTVVDRVPLALGENRLEIYNIEQPGNGSGLVFVDATAPANQLVLATYSNAFGGNGSHLKIVATWLRSDCPMAMIVVQEDDEYRGFYGVPGDESTRVDPETEQSFTVLGVSPQGIWQASHVLGCPVLLKVRQGWPQLECSGAPSTTLRLRQDSMRFEPVARSEQ
jgi:hypothetical protein